ncbi:MAG: hypothetical protein WC865_15005 [Bacteroidales bacterium]
MKAKIFILASAFCGLFLAQSASFGQKAKSVYYYPVKSAYVESVYSGSTTGTETFYMDNNGKVSARYSELTTKSLGSTTKTNQIVIQKDSVFYSIDMDKKTGVKQTIHIDPKDAEKWTKTAEEVWTDMGFKKTGEEVLLGKKCDIWEGMSSKVWVWQNFALKTEMNLFGKSVIEAKKIDIGLSIDKSKFEIPAGITMTESTFNASDPALDTLGNELKKGLNDLKDMFAPKKKK